MVQFCSSSHPLYETNLIFLSFTPFLILSTNIIDFLKQSMAFKLVFQKSQFFHKIMKSDSGFFLFFFLRFYLTESEHK